MNDSEKVYRVRKFRKAIEAKCYDEALKLIDHAPDLIECEMILSYCLWKHKIPHRVLDAALQAFMDVHDRPSVRHGAWVHSLCHLLWAMWPRRMTGWIKKFYEISFRGARELGEPTCCDRLIDRFTLYAKWSDDPVKFSLTSENIDSLGSEVLSWLMPHSRSRIREGPFQSDASFLRWQIMHPESFYERHDTEIPNVSFTRLHSRIKRLSKKGTDTQEFIEMEKQLVADQLRQLTKLLDKSEYEWETKQIAKRITHIAKFLAGLAYSDRPAK